MSHGRKPALSLKTLTRLYEEVIKAKPPESLKDRISFYSTLFVLFGLILLIAGIPIVILLYLFTPIHLGQIWLQIGATLFLIGFLGFLPGFAQQSPQKAIASTIIAGLIFLCFYLFTSTTLPMTIAQIPGLIAYGLLYAWEGAELLQEYHDKHRTQRKLALLCLATILSGVCFGIAVWLAFYQGSNSSIAVYSIFPYTYMKSKNGRPKKYQLFDRNMVAST